MILWRLRGVTSKEVVCEVEKHPGRYRLVVKRGDEVMVDEAHDSVEEARAKAEVFREKLESIGWEALGESPLRVLTREAAPKRTLIKIPQRDHLYDVEEWNRWCQGAEAGFRRISGSPTTTRMD